MNIRSKIAPCLWFDTQAEEAANHYVSIFKNARIVNVTHYNAAGPREAGMVMTVDFELDGQQFTALNGGPEFKFSEAVSLQIYCDDQAEVDYYWQKLTADGGEESVCGWLRDKYGLSWQVVPKALIEMVTDSDPEKAGRAMEAMLKMQKIDIAVVQRAYDGKAA